MLSLRSLLGGVTLALVCAFSAPVHADITSLSDNFNGENGGSGALNYAGFANWNVSNGTVDLIGNGFFDFYPGNGLYVDLDGSTGNAGKLETKDAFAPGNYQLRFDLGGSQRGDTNTAQVLLGDYSELFTLGSSAPLATIIRNITLTASAKLSFDHAGGDNLGLILDNVNVSALQSPSPASAPEPASCVLLALSAAPLLRRFRRRGAPAPAG